MGLEGSQRQLPGYGRELTQEEQSAISRFSEVSTELQTQIQRLKNLGGVDQKWVSQAETQLQTGFMCLYRAIQRPTTF